MSGNSLLDLINTDLSNQLSKLYCSPGGVIDPHESIYAVMSRFALANTLSKRDLADLFKSRVLRSYLGPKGLNDITSINSEQVMRRLEISQSQLNEMFLPRHPGLQRAVCCLYFRYCSICASAHRHYTVFQAEALSRCPFHSLPLRTTCAYCGESMLYNWSSTLLSCPFRCAHCREALGVKHGSRVFFDLHTTERAHRLAWVNGHRTEVRSLKQTTDSGSGTGERECPGYLVYGSSHGSFDQWCAMVKLPLYGRNWIDKDWSRCAGYIQIRGARIRTLRKRHADETAHSHPEVASYLMQCLKSILRNLRNRWNIGHGHQPYGNGGVVDTQDGWQRHREEAYNLLSRHWYGSFESRMGGDGGSNRPALSMIKKWLSNSGDSADTQAMPTSVYTWFRVHQFCDWVVESIATIARMIDRPPSIPDSCLVEQIQRPQKPLWLVAFIESAAYTSYRVLHYQHYPDCLSSAEVWFGSNDVD